MAAKIVEEFRKTQQVFCFHCFLSVVIYTKFIVADSLVGDTAECLFLDALRFVIDCVSDISR